MKPVFQIFISIYLLLINCIHCYSQDKTYINNTYLIVLDIQRDYIANIFPDSLVESEINSINYLIEKAGPEKVIYVVSLGFVLHISLKGISLDTSISPDLDKRLKLVNEHVIVKAKANAFKTEDIVDFLEKNEARKILVVGLLAEKCVYKTLLGGKKLGYEMCTVPEAIISETKKEKEKTVKALNKKGIILLPMNEIRNIP